MSALSFMNRHRLTCALGALLPLELVAARLGVAHAADVPLVTAGDARRYAELDVAMDRMLQRSLPGPPPRPRIDLLRPVLDPQLRLKSPFPIEVRFIPWLDAAIDPGSFRVLHGNLRLDVTARILD